MRNEEDATFMPILSVAQNTRGGLEKSMEKILGTICKVWLTRQVVRF